jgi:hypothetical protein
MPSFRFHGTSGRSYGYELVDPTAAGALKHGGGNYIFAGPMTGASGPIVFYIGETDSIPHALGLSNRWKIATSQYPGCVLYVHLQQDPESRRAEKIDLVKRHNPPMNALDTGAEDQE